MKFYTVNKFIEELELLLEGKIDTLTVVMSGEDMMLITLKIHKEHHA